MTRDEIQGLEFDWFATDSDGHIAMLSSAGTALVPDVALANESAIDALKSHFRPTRTLGSEWEQFAAAGLYVYDCDPPLHGHYRLVARPAAPMAAAALPRAYEVAVRAFTFTDFCFSDREEIRAAEVPVS